MNDLIEILRGLNCVALLDSYLTVKMSPHTPPLRIILIYFYDGEIYILDKDHQSKKLSDCNQYVYNSVSQRLRLIKFNSK